MVSFAVIYWDPSPVMFTVPVLQVPIFWYGFLFALGFVIGMPLLFNMLVKHVGYDQKRQATSIADRLFIYIIIATIVGARIGHFLFYEPLERYLKDPFAIFRIWEGGLASHGALFGLMVTVFLFSYTVRSVKPHLSWMRLFDFVCVPTPAAGCCIRIGNFVNQEILGLPSQLPWAVVFGHPADGSLPLARHPVQIYESIYYFIAFFILWHFLFKPSFRLAPGKLFGFHLILMYGFRFCIEYCKTEQSQLLVDFPLTMGQLLCIPSVLIGFVFLWWTSRSKNSYNVAKFFEKKL